MLISPRSKRYIICKTLSEKFKTYSGILPYFSSVIYAYQRMSMGLSTSPAIWQSYINAILSSIPNRSKYLSIMDDLLLQSSKHSHLKYMKDLLKALLKSGLKISAKKCQLFRTE